MAVTYPFGSFSTFACRFYLLVFDGQSSALNFKFVFDVDLPTNNEKRLTVELSFSQSISCRYSISPGNTVLKF